MVDDFTWIKENFKSNFKLKKRKDDILVEDVISIIVENNKDITQSELEDKYHVIKGMADAISTINKNDYKDMIKARSEGYVTLLIGEDKFNNKVLLVAIEGDFKNNTEKL